MQLRCSLFAARPLLYFFKPIQYHLDLRRGTAESRFSRLDHADEMLAVRHHGLVVITGSSSIVTEYWHYKGIKKL